MSEEFGQGYPTHEPSDDNIRSSGDHRDRHTTGQGTQNVLRTPVAPESVVDEGIAPGGANVNGGVARRRRRAVKGLSSARLGGPVPKNYKTTNAIMFNNFEEMVQDSISREYAQEIIEELFDKWGIPTHIPEVTKYAEDALWTFLIAVTASNKADYNRSFDIPNRNGDDLVADFGVLSGMLESVYGVTRRQFVRALADDLRSFLRSDENQHILPILATRVGCEPLLAYLAFDGSTHCTGMTTREAAFTKTLESRNLFEDDSVNGVGASERLFQGFSGGSRSVVPR